MIKKIIACLTICFIITGILSPVFSDASALPQPNWSDPGISEIINISDLTGWMLNGGIYDVSTYTDAESFMNDYFAARTKTRLEGSDYVVKSSFGLEQQYYEVGDSAYAHPLDVNRVISSSFRDHSGYGRRLSNEVNNALLSTGSLYDTKIPLLNEIEFANFVGYNHDALNLYGLQFINTDAPEANPDPNYISYINTINGDDDINGLDFFWKSYTDFPITGVNLSGIMNQDLSNYSWMVANLNNNIVPSANSSNVCEAFDIFDIYITSSNGLYSFSNSNLYSKVIPYNNSVTDNKYPSQFRFYSTYINASYWNTNPNASNNRSISRSNQTLEQCFQYLANKVRNVNIYVDGVLWAAAGKTAPTITPEFPDAVGGEDLPTTTWPISKPRAPYYTSVPGMLQAIEDAIEGDGVLDIDDLKPYLTDENGDPVPDPIFDPEPVPIPVPDPVNPEIIPGLPEIPVIPLDMPGYNGVSVLAEIINFTNQSLPTSLIVTFWGIVFGIVILGLIKILHK